MRTILGCVGVFALVLVGAVAGAFLGGWIAFGIAGSDSWGVSGGEKVAVIVGGVLGAVALPTLVLSISSSLVDRRDG
jgi:hypothetical protein